jgi:hypothetical protein
MRLTWIYEKKRKKSGICKKTKKKQKIIKMEDQNICFSTN